MFDIDYQGARQIKARLPGRGRRVRAAAVDGRRSSSGCARARADDDATIERRFRNAKREIEHYGLFDYVIVNDDLELAKQRLRGIVLAEQARSLRMATAAEALLRRDQWHGIAPP